MKRDGTVNLSITVMILLWLCLLLTALALWADSALLAWATGLAVGLMGAAAYQRL